MKIWANTIVNNEENFIWFAVMSVLDFVDKVLIWDTGSTDRTVEIINRIKKIKGKKIEFKEVGTVDSKGFTKLRQAQLEASNCDWILILDGDEIWWDKSIKKVIQKINKEGSEIDGIVVPMIVPVGDIYHIQQEAAGKYKLLGRQGHYSLRAINRKIPGLYVDWPYGKEGYFDKDNTLIQEREGMIFLDAPYLHVTHLKRSASERMQNKFKHELDSEIPEGFKYPEVLYKDFPEIIPSPWNKISGTSAIKAKILTPLRKFKRKFL